MATNETFQGILTEQVQNTEYRWIRDKKVSVIGAAISGVGAARFLKRHGAHVFVSERADKEDKIDVLAAFESEKIEAEFGGHTDRALECDFMVISPGVPMRSEIIERAVSLKIPVYSEIEVASWFLKSPAIAVTGSNGKTTTTTLIGEIMKQANVNTIVAGNIGRALSDFVDTSTEDGIAVVEVSSYQAEGLLNFRPKVGVLLNLSPDHLDRYDDALSYYLAKKKLFENQRSDDFIVYNADDEVCERIVQDIRARKIPFSTRHSGSRFGAFVDKGWLTVAVEPDTEERILEIGKIGIPGRHNLANAMAAALASRLTDVPINTIRNTLQSFKGVPHRLEFVREVGKVRFYNDSKATNVGSVWHALDSFKNTKILLIAGGKDKGTGYEDLKSPVSEKVKALVLIGEAAHRIESELGDLTRVEHADSMERAVSFAFKLASPGDVVLLSPACASFDMFDNFEHRGETFKKAVKEL